MMIAETSILIVENHKKIAERMQHSLQRLGYQNIQIAPSNPQALKSLKKNSPDIVFMDIMLEDNSSATKAAHKIVHDRNIPMIYVSEENKANIQKRIKSTDPYAQMIKPDDASQLKTVMNTAVVHYRLENKAVQIESQIHTAFDHVKDAVIITDKNTRIVFINKTAGDLFFHHNAEILGHKIKDVFQLKNNASKKIIPDPVLKALKSGTKEIKGQAVLLCLMDGNSWPIEFAISKIRDGAVFIFRKNADTFDLQPSDDRLQSILESAVDGIILVDMRGIICQVNSALCNMIGISHQVLIGQNTSKLAKKLLGGKDRIRVLSYVKDMFQEKNVEPYELEFNNRIFEIHTPRAQGNLGFIVIFHDITERIKQENKIRMSLHEKEILLQEIHHRVKNNLQIISSLLHLQSFQFTDDKILNCIRQSQNRIRTMAILHEQLYHTEDFSHIDFEYYVRALIRHLFNQHIPTQDRVSLHLNIEKCNLSIKNSVYCGLIINELISNALKYAFPSNQKGNITVSMRQYPKEVKTFELIVKYDGVEIPKNVDIRNTHTLGLRLVRLLCEEQMHGKLIFKRTPETLFHIIFKEKQSEKHSNKIS
ncbi:PAS domain S-box protein [bacterium]|nr:PAS domain S-box protein [bacterium]